MCGAVVVEGHKLGGMAKLLSLRLSYRTTFTNVLSVKVVANPKKINVSPSIEMKKDSLVRMVVEYYYRLLLCGVQMSQGVECETESNTLSLEVTIRHLQRLKVSKAMTFHLGFVVTTGFIVTTSAKLWLVEPL